MMCPQPCARRDWPEPSGVEPTRRYDFLSARSFFPRQGGGAFADRNPDPNRGHLLHLEIVPGDAWRAGAGGLRVPAGHALARVLRAATDGHLPAAEFFTHLSADVAGDYFSAGTAAAFRRAGQPPALQRAPATGRGDRE